MGFAIIDTLRFANTLKAAGMPPVQAEAQALLMGEFMRLYLEQKDANDELRREVESLRRELSAVRAGRG